MNTNETNRRAFLKSSAAIGASASLTVGLSNASPANGRRERIKIGQIGVGHAHATKLSVYRESPDYEVVGIVEPDAELRQRAENQPAFRGLPWMTREQLLNANGLQAVLVETRVGDLLTTAEACVNAGKHVHIDKPAGESLPHFRRILQASQRQGLMVQMGYMYRYNPAVALLREFLRRGWLGEIFELGTVMSKVVPAAERQRLAQFRGGMMFELGCHVIDLVVDLLGKPDEVTPYIRRSPRLGDDLADNMLAVFSYERAVATVKTTALEVEGGDRRHLVVCGTQGTFHIQPLDNPSARVALARPMDRYRAGYQELRFPRYVRYVDDAADMARVIRGEKANDFPISHDLAVQETILKACGMG